MADNIVPITAGTGTSIRTVTNAGVDNGAHQQIIGIANSDGSLLPFDPDGTLQVSDDPTALFLDDFSGTLTNNWVTGGTAPSISGGGLTTNVSTTASATSYMRTIGQFLLRPASYLRNAFLVQINSAVITNNTRWWGYGQNQTTPSATAPVLNGAVFMLDYSDGTLRAATYSAGTRIFNTTISSRPTDNAYHRYEIQYRQSTIYWLLDGAPVAQVNYPNLAVATNMYEIVGSANFSTAPTTAPQLVVTSVSTGDSSRTNNTLSDGMSPWIQATVRQTMQLPTAIAPASDSALVVHNYPTTSLQATVLSSPATAATLTLAAPGAGLRHYITGVWFQRAIGTATTGAASGYQTGGSNHGLLFMLPSESVAIGVVNYPVAINFNSPVPTLAQNTATTFTTPAVTGTVYRISVTYFIAA